LAEIDLRELPPGNSRFFARTGPHRLADVAKVAGADLVVGDMLIHGVAPLQMAGPSDVSFLDNRRYAELLATTRAGAVIVHPELAAHVPPTSIAVPTSTPYVAWAKVATMFFPLPPTVPGVHASAVVDPSAQIDATAEIGPNAVVEANAIIGARSRIGPGTQIAKGVLIGSDCRIGALVTVSHAVLADRVTLFPGVRIGQEGFGFAQTDRGFMTVPQLGRVIIENDVEIGANTTIDRGSMQDTVIGAGSRLDNLVMIGHNVRVGRCCVIVAQAGIAGSTTLGDFVVVAAQVGISGHLTVGKKARIGAQAGVMADVAEGADLVGSPAEPVRDFFRGVATLRKLSRRPRTAGNQSSD
jgi:UDP-3-O-[3-hydroxymyristoyl] glucosamine N-acyltransferase